VSHAILGVDVGGTFTDAVVAVEGRLVTAKAPTTPADQSEGVMAAVTAALERAGCAAGAVERFAHGMTVATNALLEGEGARTALVATEGFTDLVELGRQARPQLYRLCAAGPAPLVPAERRFAAPERMAPEGPLRALDAEGVHRVCDAVAAADPEAVAVVLLHSYRHPEHERVLGAALAERLPGVHVSLSHEVVGTFREYERALTTEVDAALSPLLRGYLERLVARAGAGGLPEPAIMQSSGGLTDAGRAGAHAALTVLSGPAAGAGGAARVALASGEPDVLGFDMGGTSCDVCVIDGGRPHETAGREVGERALALPMLDVHTVGAGGGSIAWRDSGGALRVGPRSAGARPGPACYGHGGREPAVTDASMVLGHLDPGGELPGGVRLDRGAAERAVGELARALGLEPRECAAGILRVAAAEMAGALRVITVERGVDPRRYALLAFGGAGPMHAIAVAEELGMTRVVCPAASGVLAALGLVISERRRDVQRSLLLGGEALTEAALADAWGSLATRAREELGDPEAAVRAVYALRYRGQAFELELAREDGPSRPAELLEAFAEAHQERYGYRDPEGEVELVTLRVTAAAPAPELDLASAAVAAPARTQGTRRAVFGGIEHEAVVLRGGPAPGSSLEGPAICELPEATLVVPPGWRARGDDSGATLLDRMAA